MSTKRLAKEREAAARPKPDVTGAAWQELQALLDQELKVLPDIYRAAIVLCDLEGKSIKEAARQLGCPQGTVGTRLARGRVLLSRRLARRGLTLSGGLIATVIAQNAAAAGVPSLLMSSTINAAPLIAAGQATAGGVISAKVAALTEGVIMNMFLSKFKGVISALAIALIGLAAWGVGSPAMTAIEVKPAEQQKANKSVASRPVAATDKKTPVEVGEQINAIWITNKSVQQELRLTEAQVKKIEAIRRAVYRKHEAELKEVREEAKKHNYGRYQEVSLKIQAEERKALTEAAPEILSAGALTRLRQIQRQARGLHHVVQEPAVQKKLNLNDEQVKSIEVFLKQGLEESRKEAAKWTTRPELAPVSIEDHVAMQKRAYAGAMKGVVGVFTEAQRRVWNDLAGEPFAFKAAPSK